MRKMDLTTRWIQSTKFAEIDRIIERLPQEGKEIFISNGRLLLQNYVKKFGLNEANKYC